MQEDTSTPAERGQAPDASTPTRAYGPMTPAQNQTPDTTETTRAYGPMTPAQNQAPAGESMEDRIVARLLAVLGPKQDPGVPPAPSDLSEEDQRLVGALAGVHPSGRDVRITKRESLVGNLYYVTYSYSPATGARQDVHALVYDNGKDNTRIFGGF